MRKGYSAYNLSPEGREALLRRFPSKFSNVVAHHATYKFGVSEDLPIPHAAHIEVVGYASNKNIECVVVKINGTFTRDDGKTFHITLSHNDNAKPVDSNDLCAAGWDLLVDPFVVPVTPTFNAFK